MNRSLHVLLASSLLAAGLSAGADTLLIEGIDRSAGPTRGMSMDRVEARYGAPIARRSPVGEPPITRWDYPDFVVYFEHHLVIHSVHKRGSSS